MNVVVRLVFGEHFGVFELADVVVVCSRAGKFGIFAYGLGARFGYLCHRHGVVVCAGRVVFEALNELGLFGCELAQAEDGKFGEHRLEHRQKEHIQQHREEGRERAVKQHIEQLFELFGVYRAEQDGYYLDGDEQHERDEHAAHPRLDFGHYEYAYHARAERHDQQIVAY